ncbi:RecX family transcriptional regulator [Eubacteriales bacterium OttesenSCG-928-G02]|nr:RecX family transcriptional regulator [Eubacteriales bacterium OttesenSCG-928-G02]
MPVVTKIINYEDKNEYGLTVDGVYYHITKQDFNKLNINEFEEIDLNIIEVIENADLKLKCIKKAFQLLSYSDLSSKKLKEKLAKSFEKEVVIPVIGLLTERGYLNDAVLAKRYYESYVNTKLWGPIRIKNALFQKGFSKDDIEYAFEDEDEELYLENIEKIIDKKYSGYNLEDHSQKQKIVTGMLRMGYPYSLVADAISRIE